jgi:catechol 2,3-dioxygenase-like lactoylglutathione lyase family enzyme
MARIMARAANRSGTARHRRGGARSLASSWFATREKETEMDKSNVRCVKSIVLTSDQPEALARFYRETLELPLEREQHRGTTAHWAGQFGALHLAIHERATFWLPTAAPAPDAAAATVVTFTVEDLDALVARLGGLRVEVVARTKIGPMSFVAFRDPDGRYVCCGTPWPGN